MVLILRILIGFEAILEMFLPANNTFPHALLTVQFKVCLQVEALYVLAVLAARGHAHPLVRQRAPQGQLKIENVRFE